jgi:peroxiredoxin
LQQLVQLQQSYAQFKARGVEILALAYQDQERAQRMQKAALAEFPILADTDHRVADQYQVFNVLNDGVNAPAVFVVDRAGHIAWSYISKDANDRPDAQTILNHIP